MKHSIETNTSLFSEPTTFVDNGSNSLSKSLIKTYMVMKTKQVQFRSNYFSKNTLTIRADMIFGIIYKICSKMSLKPKTYFRAISLFDMIVTNYKISPEKLNVVFLICLSLSSKIIENFDQYIDISMVKKVVPEYSIEQLVILEINLFSKLNFQINCPTTFDFLKILMNLMEERIIYCSEFRENQVDMKIIHTICEENLLNLLVEGSVIIFSQNLIALSVLILVLTKLKKIQIFENLINEFIPNNNNEFQECFSYSESILYKINSSFFK